MIRKIIKSDLPALKIVLDNCELFPSEYLKGMIADYFNNSDSEDIWLTYVLKSKVVAMAYCAPMELTNGTYNLYAIGVHNDVQRQGIGSEMMNYIEERLKTAEHRLLIIETSSSESQMPARNFYHKCNYTHEATLRDFWDDGDDKVVFWKKL